MRSLTRVGVAAAATVLASTTALLGAGVAGAQSSHSSAGADQDASGPTYNSPSSIAVGPVSPATDVVVVSYANRSGQDLFCLTVLSTAAVVDAYSEYYRTADHDSENPELPPSLEAVIEAAENDGQYGYLMFDAAAGSRGPVEATIYQYPVDQTFVPEAISICYGMTGYIEVERTTSGGFLGSLPLGSTDLLSGGGSVTGSLGS